MIRRLLFLLPLAAAIGLQQGAGTAPDRVEAVYSRTVYPRLAALLSTATAPLPFALADVLLFAVLAVLLVLLTRWVRVYRMERRRALGLAVATALVGFGVAYLAFLLLWGLNYRREPLAMTLGLDTQPAPLEDLAQLAEELTAETNALRSGRAEEAGVFRLDAGLSETLRRAPRGFEDLAPLPPLPAAARPKPSLTSPLLARSGISGIFIPFTGEPLVNALVPASEIPFNASHELAHLLGWAREDEANFVAFVACRRHPDPDFGYSGALVAGLHAVGALSARDRQAAQRIVATRSPEVARDVAAIRAWRLKYEGALTRVGDRVNDTYLRSQGDPRGLESYGRMVDLLLAARRAGRLDRMAP